jgi:hypothetical protein
VPAFKSKRQRAHPSWAATVFAATLPLLLLGGCRPPVPAPPAETPTPTASPTPVPEPSPAAADVGKSPALLALETAGRKTILVHYMPWYETPAVRGKWGVHWTGHKNEHNPEVLKENGLPDIWSHYHPLIGPYDSADPAVLECQLLQMKLAGANGVIVDWYGVYPANDFPDIHAATEAMFEAAGKNGMSFAACYEDRTLKVMLDQGKITPEQVPDLLRADLKWAADHWFPAGHHQRFRDKPLLLTFGPLQVKDRETWSQALDLPGGRPAFFALHHLWQGVGADGGFSWVHTEPFDGEPSPDVIQRRLTATHEFRSKNPDESIPSAYPGWRDIYEVSYHEPLDRRDGRTMRETLQAAMDGPWPMVQLVTWNDYGEGTVIEPTHEYGYDALEAVQEARRKEIGEAFAFTADDLRLPARLLTLRRASAAPVPELDRISALLGAGRTDEARSLLDAVSTKTSEP